MSFSARRGGPKTWIQAVALLGSVEFIAAALAITLGFQKAETPVLLGLSPARLGLAIVALLLSAALLTLGLLALRRDWTLPKRLGAAADHASRWLTILGILAAAFCWISVLSPAYVFGESADYFSRLRPLLIAGSLFVGQVWIATALSRKTDSVRSWLQGFHIPNPRGLAALLLCLLAAWLFMLVSKFGIEKAGPFWNPPGMPVTGLQGIGVVVLICLGILVMAVTSQTPAPTRGRIRRWILPVAIYVCAVLVWGLTPMQRHYFALRPAPPSYQPFPFSDARNYDLGGLSIINGQGIFFHDYTDKPLYMVFVAFLHLLGGDNYVLITWLQVAVLACIPVMLFVLGRRFGSDLLGMAAALLTIFQQANSIQASREIDSVNPKLLMTEVPALLCLTIVAYLLFRWFRTRRLEYALGSGAAIGAASAIRANPLILVLAAGVLAIIVLWKQRSLLLRHILLFGAGFLIVFSPWLVTGVDEHGVPWMWVKIQFVIGQRFQSMLSPPALAAVSGETVSRLLPSEPPNASDSTVRVRPLVTGSQVSLNLPAARVVEHIALSSRSAAEAPLVSRVLSHFAHNAAAALLSLPNLLTLDGLDQLSQNAPWGTTTWRGYLTTGQHLAAAANLVLLAIGLAWSWRRFSLAGLIPAIVFLAYDLSLALATTSGGRYIVPVNWVAHFYYAAGWIVLVAVLARIPLPTPGSAVTPTQTGESWGRNLAAPGVAIVILALLIPVANVLIPRIVHPRLVEQAQSELSAVSPKAGDEVQLVYGKVLYPYYHSDSRAVSFHLLTDAAYWPDLVVLKKRVFPYSSLRSGSFGLAGVSGDAPGHAVRFLYVAPNR